MYREAEHPSRIHLLATEAQDGVHQGDNVSSGKRELLQAIPGYNVNGATRVDQNSPQDYACYFHLDDQGLLWGEANRETSFPPNTIVATVTRGPCSMVSTCCALLS